MNIYKTLLILCATLIALPGFAGPYTDAMSTCLADSTTGKERKELARWIFAAMSTHPDMRDISSATDETRDKIQKTAGTLVTRLLSEDCSNQARIAMQKEGSESMQAAFGALGKLAMQELTTNREFNAALSGIERYVDRKKLEAALAAK
jgi:uncharacterized protein Yka (UPF0111/DUF47 family)